MPRKIKAPKLHVDDVVAPTSPSGKKYVRGPNKPEWDMSNALERIDPKTGQKTYMGARQWKPADGDYSQAMSRNVWKKGELTTQFSGVRKLPPNNGWGEWSPSYGR